MTRTLWFSYSIPVVMMDGPEPLQGPYNHTWHLIRMFREQCAARGWRFEYRQLDDLAPHDFGPDDIVIGHPWYPDGFVNRAIYADPGPRYKIIMQPYTPGMFQPAETARQIEMMERSDHTIAITGPYWWDTWQDGPYGPLQHKCSQLELAITPALHPYLKRKWNPPGQRAFLALGNDKWYKGAREVAELARVSGIFLGHCGNAGPEVFEHVANMKQYGWVDFTPSAIQALVDEYDFFITMGREDANPYTLFEASAWGLAVACTKESGYWPGQPFLELRLDDMPFNLDQIHRLQHMPELDLRRRSREVADYITSTYTWERFKDTVWRRVLEVIGERD